MGGKDVDVQETLFGFREWTSEGINFKLNGITWHGRSDAHGGEPTAAAWLGFPTPHPPEHLRFRERGNGWYGMTTKEMLEFMDRAGQVVRIEGILNGEGAGYQPIENDPDLRAKYNSEIKMDLALNWRDQMVASVKALRNHPSVAFYTEGNEWSYINVFNLGYSDLWEPEIVKT
jgi:hypothetical protein